MYSFNVGNDDHHEDAEHEREYLLERLDEAAVALLELRYDRDGGDVDEAAGRERQDARGGQAARRTLEHQTQPRAAQRSQRRQQLQIDRLFNKLHKAMKILVLGRRKPK